MACFHPLKAYKSASPSGNGKRPLLFKKKGAFTDLPLVNVPCGQCIGCRMDRAREWATRCWHESQLHAENCFLTLTYDEAHVYRKINPETGEIVNSLRPEDITLFFKNLRYELDKFGIKIRYFQCGEYGERFGRPHHHVLLFGHSFPERDKGEEYKGNRYYHSDFLDEIWGKGKCIISDLTYDSAAYTCRYVLKKVKGEHSKNPDVVAYFNNHYENRHPEYVTMSRKPGIGRNWINEFMEETYVHDGVNIGKKHLGKVPRYYDKVYDAINHEEFLILKSKRVRKAKIRALRVKTASLQIREKALQLRVKNLKRDMEG